MSLHRTVVAIIVAALAYSVLMFMPANVPSRYENGIDVLVALIAFAALAWAFVPGRRR